MSPIGRRYFEIRLMIIYLVTITVSVEAQEPNIVFIAVDDLNCDIGAYGNPNVKSPHIDQIANEAVVFMNNHCQRAVCGASRASLLSGFTPEHTGVTSFHIYMRDLYPDMVTLPQFFKNHGYITVGMGKIHDPRNVSETDGVDLISWSNWIDITGSRWLVSSDRPVTEKANLPDNSYVDGMIADAAVQQIQSLAGGSEPFFLAVGFKKPHLPFVAPSKYWDRYYRDSIPLAPFRKWAAYDEEFVHNPGSEFFNSYDHVPEPGTWSFDLQREYIHGYYACVSFIDAQVGRLINELKSQGIYDNTIIVLWGDHGFSLGDHTNWGKHTNFEYATRSPLIVRVPGVTSGSFSHAPSEHLDIYPTLVDLAGFEVPDTLDGNSLVPVLAGQQERVKSFAVSQFRRGGKQGFVLRSDYYQYVEWLNNDAIAHRQLFNLADDPYQTINLAEFTTYQEIVDSFSFYLNQYLEEGINNPALNMVSDTDSMGLYGSYSNLAFNISGDTSKPVPLGDATISIEPFELPTASNGYTALQLQPGTYTYQVFKEDYWPVNGTLQLGENDTLVSDTLLRRFFYLDISVLDSTGNAPLRGIHVSLGVEAAVTDYRGIASFRIEPGDHILFIEHETYKDIEKNVYVFSDSTLTLKLKPEFASAKFKTFEGDVPVNNAQVSLNGKVKFTNAIGIAEFKELNINSSIEYKVFKAGYSEITGTFTLEADTTLDLELEPAMYTLELNILDSSDSKLLDQVSVTIKDSIKYSDTDGKVKFYELTMDDYLAIFEKDGYQQKQLSIEVLGDTIMDISLARLVSTSDKTMKHSSFYPNPAYDRVFYSEVKQESELVIYDMDGRNLGNYRLSGSGSLDLSHLKPGFYIFMIEDLTYAESMNLIKLN